MVARYDSGTSDAHLNFRGQISMVMSACAGVADPQRTAHADTWLSEVSGVLRKMRAPNRALADLSKLTLALSDSLTTPRGKVAG